MIGCKSVTKQDDVVSVFTHTCWIRISQKDTDERVCLMSTRTHVYKSMKHT